MIINGKRYLGLQAYIVKCQDLLIIGLALLAEFLTLALILLLPFWASWGYYLLTGQPLQF